MKKRILVGVLVGVLLIGVFVGGSFGDEPVAQKKLLVVCTTNVLDNFVAEAGRDRIEIHTIVAGGTCPSHYDIKPSDAMLSVRPRLFSFTE